MSRIIENPYENFIALSRYARWISEDNRREKWGEVQSRAALVKQLVDLLEIKTAALLKLSIAEYRARVVNANFLLLLKSLSETTVKAIPHRQVSLFPCKYQSLLKTFPPFVSATVAVAS